MSKTYDKAIGYSPLECADPKKLQQVIHVNKTIINEYYSTRTGDMILVAGTGTGLEAALVQREFNLRTIGVDLNINQDLALPASQDLGYQKQDLTSLGFSDNSFALVYCYHVLEHVPDHSLVLREIRRVLKPKGVLFLGFPNKNRLVSYIGTSQKASVLEKVKWNLNDYAYRLAGKFENAIGAHAGFSEREFIRESSKLFDAVWPVRNQYMLLKYPRHVRLIRLLIATGLEEIMFPSNYYVCVKSAR